MIQIDMEMPKRCINCPLCKHIHLVDSPLLIYACGKGMRPIYSHETAEGVDEFSKMEKPEWCPLREARPANKVRWHTTADGIPEKGYVLITCLDHYDKPFVMEKRAEFAKYSINNETATAWAYMPEPYHGDKS